MSELIWAQRYKLATPDDSGGYATEPSESSSRKWEFNKSAFGRRLPPSEAQRVPYYLAMSGTTPIAWFMVEQELIEPCLGLAV
ncbi:hypothetical protein R1flu_025793 [Riccia fluitans]|uniref:Uncharacterized protein n=1 Tax=Riccia fluitans TaxID=41844 RepID=A0ABD1Y1Q9_9MARC